MKRSYTNTNVLLYCRINTDKDLDYEQKLNMQEKLLREYCNSQGYNVLKVYGEDYDSYQNKIEWNKLESFASSNSEIVEKVLCTTWDRYSRNHQEVAEIIKKLEGMGIEVDVIKYD